MLFIDFADNRVVDQLGVPLAELGGQVVHKREELRRSVLYIAD